jgi:hypothetical protein
MSIATEIIRDNGRNVPAASAFRVRHDVLTGGSKGPRTKGQIVDGAEFGEQLARLVRIKALEPLPGVEVPLEEPTVVELQDQIESIHEMAAANQDANEQLKAELLATNDQLAAAIGERNAYMNSVEVLNEQLKAEKAKNEGIVRDRDQYKANAEVQAKQIADLKAALEQKQENARKPK